jgi:hypothetical protein
MRGKFFGLTNLGAAYATFRAHQISGWLLCHLRHSAWWFLLAAKQLEQQLHRSKM